MPLWNDEQSLGATDNISGSSSPKTPLRPSKNFEASSLLSDPLSSPTLFSQQSKQNGMIMGPQGEDNVIDEPMDNQVSISDIKYQTKETAVEKEIRECKEHLKLLRSRQKSPLPTKEYYPVLIRGEPSGRQVFLHLDCNGEWQ